MNNGESDRAGSPFTPVNLVFIILALALFATFFVGGLNRDNTWGINQLSYLPGVFKIVWIALALFVAVFFFVAPPRHYFSDWLAPWLWGDRKNTGRILTALAAMIFFALLRYTAHLYDNSYILIANIAQRDKTVFELTSYGATMIPYAIYHFLHLFISEKITAAIAAYQTVAILSGGAFIYISAMIAQKAFDDPRKRLTFGFFLVFSGISLYFFGMVDIHIVLLPVFALFAFYTLMVFKIPKRKYLLYLWIISFFGILIHVQFVTILPGLLFITALRFVPRKEPQYLPAFLGSILVIAVFTVVYFIRADGNLALEAKTLFIHGKPPDTDYGIFGLPHLTDVLNLVLMTVPLAPIFLLAVILGMGKLRRDPIYLFLIIVTAAQAVYRLALDPGNGMARDFTDYVFLMSGFIFLGAYSLLKLIDRSNLSRDSIMAFCPAALVIMIPIFWVHLSPGLTEKYLDDYIDKNPNKYESYLIAKRDHYYAVGDFEKSMRFGNSITAKAPGALESKLINDLYAAERYQDAFNYASMLIEKFPYNPKYHIQMGHLQKHFNRFKKAEKQYRIALELDPYNSEYYHWLSELYREHQMEYKVRPVLKEGLKVDPGSLLLTIDLIGHYYRNGNYDQADSLGHVVHNMDPENPYPYMYWGLIAEKKNQLTRALDNYNKFIDTDEDLPEKPIIMKRMNEIVLKQRDGLPEN